jgi:GT2 family glycosyltransferase
MNPVLMIAYNNLELTKKAVASVFAQDIPVDFYLEDNGSTDGTEEWLGSGGALEFPRSEGTLFSWHRRNINESPIRIANEYSARIFRSYPYLLGVPNDVRLPSNCYSELLRWPRGFVCASDNGQNEPDCRPGRAVSENTPMAVMLTRKWAYDAIVAKDGYFFDEGYFMYASDCDMALRMAACGIRGVQLDIPYWHYGSASHRLAPQEEGDRMRIQANEDRAYFERKWGFKVDSLEYGKRPSDINFR